MAGIVRPKNFPIRKPWDNSHENGKNYNPKRYPDHGGFTGPGALPDAGPFNVEAPEKGSRSAEVANKRTQE
jgi:hypothetical protein